MKTKYHFFIFYVLCFSASINISYAEDVFDDIVISNSGSYTGIIKIKFRVPVRYISHSPKQLGKEVLIHVDVLNKHSLDKNYRGSIVPYYEKNYGLDEVTYENIDNDDYITLYFNQKTSFEILPGADYRSLSILIHDVK